MDLLDIRVKLAYAEIAPYLGLDPHPYWPTLAQCPSCGANAWSIHQDTLNLEEWHHCSQCKYTGTVLAMAAARLNIPQDKVVERLATKLKLNPQRGQVTQLHDQLKLRNTFQSLWKTASTCLLRLDSGQRSLLAQYGWHNTVPMSQERIARGPGRLYGLLPSRLIKAKLRSNYRVSNPDTVVVPYFKGPEQIGGFACFNGKDEFYINSKKYRNNILNLGEPGFAGYDLAQASQSKVFIVTSMLSNMIRLQQYNWASSDRPLPLVAWRPGQPHKSKNYWTQLSNRKLIFWERSPTAAVIHQAIMVDGLISFIGPRRRSSEDSETNSNRWFQWIHNRPCHETVRRIVSNAVPYRTALQVWARYATTNEKIALLADAERYSAETYSKIYNILEKSSVEHERRLFAPTSTSSDLSRQPLKIIESGRKWRTTTGRICLPGILRIRRVIVRDDKQLEIVGVFVVGETAMRFHIPREELTYRFLRKLAARHNVNVVFEPGYRVDLFETACLVAPPEYCNGATTIGWNGQSFVFNTTTLKEGIAVPNPEFKLPPGSPGPRYFLSRLSKAVKRTLSLETPEMIAVWSLATAVCAQVTAPVVFYPPPSISIFRKNLDVFLTTLLDKLDITVGYYKDWRHKWPRLLPDLEQSRRLNSSSYVISLVKSEEEIRRLTDTMVVIMPYENLLTSDLFEEIQHIIPWYLRQFSSMTHTRPRSWKEWLNKTHNWMCNTFSFVHTDALHNCKTYIRHKTLLPSRHIMCD